MKNIVKLIFSKRFAVYLAGMIILAFGITLNTKTDLGVSPIISVAYTFSQITGFSLGLMTFLWYLIMIALQAVLLGKDFKLYQLLQIGVSFVTSWFINMFDAALPEAEVLWMKILLLVGAVVITAVGVVLTVGMETVPNPADGFASVLGKKLKKGLGFGKNLFDFSSIFLSLMVSLLWEGRLIGIGAGTFLTMILTGRVIALIHKYSGTLVQNIADSGQTEIL